MRFEQGPQFFPEKEKQKEEKPQKRRGGREEQKEEIKRKMKQIARRVAVAAAVGAAMLPGSKDMPQREFHPIDVPPDPHHAPVPIDFHILPHPGKGLMENLPSGVERIPEQPAEETVTSEEPRQQDEEIQETPEIQEKEIFQPHVTIIDTGLETPKEGIHQEAFPSSEEMVKRVLGDQYISKEQLREEFGEDFKQKWGEIVEKYPAAMMHMLGDRYLGHGESVADVMHNTWDAMGMKGKNVELIPLQLIVGRGSVEFVQDPLGNRGISVTFDEKRIIELLKEDTSRVVNLSFQVGDVQMFLEKWKKEMPAPEPYMWVAIDKEGISTADEESIDKIYIGMGGPVGVRGKEDGTLAYTDVHGNEIQPMTVEEFKRFQKERFEQQEAYENAPTVEIENPKVEIEGAYTKEKAERNLVRLFEICRAYPEKLFVVAGGNNGEDIREARKTLKNQWPDNLIIVGEWKGSELVHGMDVYGDNAEMKVPQGSTYSTAALSASIDVSLKRLSLFGEWKEITGRVKELATPREYTDQHGANHKALVFGQDQVASSHGPEAER